MTVIEDEYIIESIQLNSGEIYGNSLNPFSSIKKKTFNYYNVEELFSFPGIKLYQRSFEKKEEKEMIKEELIIFIPFSSIYIIKFMSIDCLSDLQKQLIEVEEDKEAISNFYSENI